MAKGYWVANVSVEDPAGYDLYRAGVPDALAAYGGRFLVRGGAQEVAEGSARPRTVVIEFPSVEAARACYGSAAYRALIPLRRASAAADLVIVAGCDG